jgi:putative flippase GtrA
LNRIPWEVVRFVLVGGAASATHFVVGLSLSVWAHWVPWQANIAAFCIALAVSYFGNSIVTFGVEARRADAFAKFALMSLAAFGLNQGIVTLLTLYGRWPYWAALCVVLAVVPPMTFVLAKYWALAERPESGGGAGAEPPGRGGGAGAGRQ